MPARIAALIARDLPDNPPEGFRPIPVRDGFSLFIGALYGRLDGGDLVLGFRCSPRHMNPHGYCHGGMLASFADMQAYSVRHKAGLLAHFTPTASLTTDYLRPVRQGDWVEARTDLLKKGRNMLFSRSLATVGEIPVFSAKAIYAIGPATSNGAEALAEVLGTA